MINVEISDRTITQPGLYIMRWKGHTGLVRVVGDARTGYQLINPEKSAESYMRDLPPNGSIPNDALFSEPLMIVKV